MLVEEEDKEDEVDQDEDEEVHLDKVVEVVEVLRAEANIKAAAEVFKNTEN